jgi:ubiquinone/menaquinone biosynthesis C-methylase UbiE
MFKKMYLKRYKQIFGEFAQDAEFIDKTIKELKLDKNSKILDIGTGLGAMSTLLALNEFNVLTGEPEFDPHKEDHESNHFHHSDWGDWRESAKKLEVLNSITFQNFDVQELPFESDSFEGIFLYDSLQHIKDRKLALRECLRVLKPDGKIIVIEWTEKQIEEDFKKYGHKIELVNPEKYLNLTKVNVEVASGNYVNIFIIKSK